MWTSLVGHPKDLREQHLDGVQQDFTFSSILIYYIGIFYAKFSKQTDINWLHERRKSTR